MLADILFLTGIALFVVFTGVMSMLGAMDERDKVRRAMHKNALKRIRELELELLDDAWERPWGHWPTFPPELERRIGTR